MVRDHQEQRSLVLLLLSIIVLHRYELFFWAKLPSEHFIYGGRFQMQPVAQSSVLAQVAA